MSEKIQMDWIPFTMFKAGWRIPIKPFNQKTVRNHRKIANVYSEQIWSTLWSSRLKIGTSKNGRTQYAIFAGNCVWFPLPTIFGLFMHISQFNPYKTYLNISNFLFTFLHALRHLLENFNLCRNETILKKKSLNCE